MDNSLLLVSSNTQYVNTVVDVDYIDKAEKCVGCGETEETPVTHNLLAGLQGGNLKERYHLNKNQYDGILAAIDLSAKNRVVTLEDLVGFSGGSGDGSGLSALQIKTLYESNVDTNAFTNALKFKLQNLDLSAYQLLLTFDTVPTLNSLRPVTSSGLKNYIDTSVSTRATLTDIDNRISNYDITLKASVPSTGDNLNKLYNLIVAGFTEVTVANTAARLAYNVIHLPTNVFVTDDGDGRWALYKAISTGTNATYIKLSDPDIMGSSLSASQIKASYESNLNTNAFTDIFKNILQQQSGTNTGDETKTSILNKIGVNDFVPYTGANATVDLGANALYANSVRVNANYGAYASQIINTFLNGSAMNITGGGANSDNTSFFDYAGNSIASISGKGNATFAGTISAASGIFTSITLLGNTPNYPGNLTYINNVFLFNYRIQAPLIQITGATANDGLFLNATTPYKKTDNGTVTDYIAFKSDLQNIATTPPQVISYTDARYNSDHTGFTENAWAGKTPAVYINGVRFLTVADDNLTYALAGGFTITNPILDGQTLIVIF